MLEHVGQQHGIETSLRLTREPTLERALEDFRAGRARQSCGLQVGLDAHTRVSGASSVMRRAFAPAPQPTSRMRALGRSASTCACSSSINALFGRSM